MLAYKVKVFPQADCRLLTLQAWKYSSGIRFSQSSNNNIEQLQPLVSHYAPTTSSLACSLYTSNAYYTCPNCKTCSLHTNTARFIDPSKVLLHKHTHTQKVFVTKRKRYADHQAWPYCKEQKSIYGLWVKNCIYREEAFNLSQSTCTACLRKKRTLQTKNSHLFRKKKRKEKNTHSIWRIR